MSPDSTPPPSGEGGRPTGRFGGDQGWPRWTIWVLFAVIAAALFLPSLFGGSQGTAISYGDFLEDLRTDQVQQATFDNTNGSISGELDDGTKFTTTGPLQPSDADQALMTEKGVKFETPTASIWSSLLPLLLPVGLLIGFFVWMQRRAQGQMGGIMSIGRSQGQDLRRRAARHHLRRRRRLRGREEGDHRGRRLPQVPGEVRRDRRPHPQGRPARRPSRHRQDAHRPGRRRRGRRAVPVGHRLRLHGDVRRRRRQPGPRPVPDRPQDGPGDHLRRRDRLDRPQARRRPRRRPRRARADAQPDARRDGRLRGHRGHRHDGGHQPARHPRPRPAAPGSLRPPGGRAPPRARRPPQDPRGARAAQAHRPRRRPRPRRPRHPRHERRRPVEPRQRGGAVRRAPWRRPRSPSATSKRPATGSSWASGASRWRCPSWRRRPSPTTRPATPSAPRCSPTADPLHKVTIIPSGMALGVTHAAARSRSATSTARTTSRTRSSCAWAAGSPRTSSSAWSPPGPTTTSSAPPSWPARWCANGA